MPIPLSSIGIRFVDYLLIALSVLIGFIVYHFYNFYNVFLNLHKSVLFNYLLFFTCAFESKIPKVLSFDTDKIHRNAKNTQQEIDLEIILFNSISITITIVH
jgi:uncharacterized membrane protein